MANEMPSPDPGRDFLQAAGVLRVNVHGREFDFRYPNSVYMRNVFLGILQGKEYPILPLPDYKPTTIVDVGANVGATAVFFHYAYPGARIYCYEPSAENYQCLAANAGT